ERGLLWLPLLGVFVWLAWTGWHEYQKLEAYKLWAVAFERAKYDIYAVLGQVGDRLVWGRPTRQGPTQVQEVALPAVNNIRLWQSASKVVPTGLPKGCTVALGLDLGDGDCRWIPFTDEELAIAWQKQLQTLRESLQSTPRP
ncbi:MAG: hypothetical protein AAF892_03410, partial [Cyanobacteria bacterium P01_D01_bin.71]